MFGIFLPKVDKRINRLLIEAQHELLDAEKALENASACARTLRVRVARLKKAAEQESAVQPVIGSRRNNVIIHKPIPDISKKTGWIDSFSQKLEAFAISVAASK